MNKSSVNKRLAVLAAVMAIMTVQLHAAVWQWSVKVTEWVSDETKKNPVAFLYIPEDCRQVRGVVFGTHNMCEEPIFEHPAFRQTLAELDLAVVWITPGLEQQWKEETGCRKAFDKMLADLAEVSGYDELQRVPIVPLGHSAMATMPWNFAAWNADRTLAVISYKGDSPRTNLCGYGRENLEWGRTRNIDGIPGLMIEGEFEWWESRVNPSLAFRMMYPNSCISFLADVGHGHFDISDEVVRYICLFLKKAVQYRLDGDTLKKLNPQEGYLAERWHLGQTHRAKTAPFNKYKGDPHDAFWYFDKEIAEATESYYATMRDKQDQHIALMQNGRLLTYNKDAHGKYTAAFEPEADGVTFHLKGVLCDETHTRVVNANENVRMRRICGPVEIVNDTTFRVRFYRMGVDNPRRTNEIWMVAYHNGDKKMKRMVQEVNLRVNYPIKEGKAQRISFPEIGNVKNGTQQEVSLCATSDSGLPVGYYVKEGPARIEGDKLVLTRIPPRAKFPVKVTVVAWQLGRKGELQSAIPVEQTFYINK